MSLIPRNEYEYKVMAYKHVPSNLSDVLYATVHFHTVVLDE